MAGSYKHCVNDEGQLVLPEKLNGMLENGGDVFEAVEELYGMVWYLANALNDEYEGTSPEKLVEEAREHYKMGIQMSPGLEEEG